MKIKTSELVGTALDWVVACIEFPDYADLRDPDSGCMGDHESYSTKWLHAGPIIERDKLCVGYKHQPDPAYCDELDPDTLCWARTPAGGYLKSGPTPLIAAMRCYVASKLGDEIEIPDCLL